MPNSCMIPKNNLSDTTLRFSTHRKEWELAQQEAVTWVAALSHTANSIWRLYIKKK